MKSFVVTGRALVRNGRTYKVGAGIQFPAVDGELLVGAGRLKVPSTTTATSATKPPGKSAPQGSDKK